MKKMFLRVIALVLAFCAMQVAFVPSVVTAASNGASGYARPVTVLDEALVRWEDDRACVAEVNGYDYLALPIYGGKMYIYNLDTQELVDEVNTEIPTPRGITVDDEGMIYLVGDSWYMYTYNLKTNQGKLTDKRFYGGGSTVYDINMGDDGKLYFGSNANRIVRYDPDTGTFTNIPTGIGEDLDGYFVPSVIKKGNYIYAAVHTGSDSWLVKLDVTRNNKFVSKESFKDTNPGTYLTHMSMTEEGIIFGSTSGKLMAVDTTTMTSLSEQELGLGESNVPIYGYVSKKINGQYYFVGRNDRYMYTYNPNDKALAKVTEWGNVGQGLTSQGKTVTLNRDGVEGEYLISFTDAQTQIIYTNVQTGNKLFDVGLFADKGASSKVNALTSGSNGELYYGGFLSNLVATYNTNTGKITNTTATSGEQTDALCVNGQYLYAGNYAYGRLTRINLNTHRSEVLFTLQNALFAQTRIHSIVAGDNKIFLGTFPDVNKRGGVIAWYDITDGRTYVAVGPTSGDVYCSDNASAASPKWYKWNDTSKKAVTSITVDGVVSRQSIKDVAYYDGILYAATSTYGGTETEALEGVSPVIIAYSVKDKKVIATYDFANKGFAANMFAIGGIEVDENGTLWGVAAETLFTLTLNQNNTFTYKEHLSFSKTNFDETQTRENSSILFKDGYVYVAFEKNGGICKVSMINSSDYTKLLPDVTDNGQVPQSLAFGEDGSLYFLLGSALKMLALDPKTSEWDAANIVTAQIGTITDKTEPAIIAQVREAYEQLTLRQKSLVQNYAVLEQAEVNVLNQDIKELGQITLADSEQIQTLMTIYKQMSKSQKSQVTNYYLLVQANQTVQALGRDYVIEVSSDSGVSYYETLEEALDATTEGTIRLLADVTAKIVDVHNNAVLDLNGHTLKADIIFANVMDSSDGEGLIEVEKNTAENKYATLTPDDQLILWDSSALGYRLFNYNFENMGKDAKENDASESLNSGTTVMSFWSKLTFENRYAYALIASGYCDLNVSFDVSWTPEGGKTLNHRFEFTPSAVTDWALAEEQNEQTDVNYCFYIRLTGFDALKTSGTVAVTPVVSTEFNTAKRDATPVDYTYKTPIDILEFETKFGDVANVQMVD